MKSLAKILITAAAIALTASCFQMAEARNPRTKTTRPAVKVAVESPQAVPSGYELVSVNADGLFADSAKVDVFGYDKVREANKESVFVRNGLNDTIGAVWLELEYFGMDSLPLHSRTVRLPLGLAPGKTVRSDFRSWDTQRIFYYHLSPAPKRRQATPYMLRAKVKGVEIRKK